MTGITHGAYAYKRKGCRCDLCKSANAEANRRWRTNRKSRGDAYVRKDREPARRRPCSTCQAATVSRSEVPICKACSMLTRRSVNVPRSVRLRIYERDNWVCGFCQEAVDPAAEHNSPGQAVLDHIIPRSHGGPDEEGNLRLLHRYCNNVRSDRLALTVDDLVGAQ